MLAFLRMSRALPAVAIAAIAQAQTQAGSDSFQRARHLFFNDSVAQSVPLFRAAVSEAPNSAERHAWLADAARRTDRYDEAMTAARRALALEPCNSFAHVIIANLFNPQYWPDSTASRDSTWTHLTRAVACDSSDGNAWLSLTYEALRVGDTAQYTRSLRALARTGFLTPVQMAYARLVLERLPPNTMLLTGGDMDTYPPLVAQALGVRPDVAVINSGMLSNDWYAEYVVARYKVGTLMTVPYDTSLSPGDNTVRLFRAGAVSGGFGRPLALALTIGRSYADSGLGKLRFEGPYWLVTRDTAAFTDTSAIQRYLNDAAAQRWDGTPVSPQDRSPIRNFEPMRPAILIAYAALTGADYLAATDPDRARAFVEWTERFLDGYPIERDLLRDAVAGVRKLLPPKP